MVEPTDAVDRAGMSAFRGSLSRPPARQLNWALDEAEGAWVSLPAVDELVTALDRKRQTDIGEAEGRLFKEYGVEALVPGFMAAYPRIKNWAGRNSILFWLIRFARKWPEVVELAQAALGDPAYMVRMRACAILAYSLRPNVIPDLQKLLDHRNGKTRDDAAAAIDAIRHRNHHYWFDRDHSGQCFWEVNPEDRRHA